MKLVLACLAALLIALTTTGCGDDDFGCADVCSKVDDLCGDSTGCIEMCTAIWSKLTASEKQSSESCVNAASTCAAINSCN